MIVNQELVKKIKDYFDLNIYETKVWLALLSKGIASAGEVAELSSVPRSRTYDVLESLEKQGFALEKIGKPAKYIAVKPTHILEKLKKNTLKKAEDKMKTLDKLKTTSEYTELESIYDSSISMVKKEDIAGALRGKSNILGHVREILENAKKEVLINIAAKEILERGRIFSNLFNKLNQNKIKIRLSLSGTGEDIKKVGIKYNLKPIKTNINSKFFIIDREQVLISLNNSQKNEDEMAVWLNSSFFSQAFASLFNLALKNR